MIKTRSIIEKVYEQFDIPKRADPPIICKLSGKYYCGVYKKEDHEESGYKFFGCHMLINFPNYPKIDLHGVWGYEIVIPWNSTYRAYRPTDRIILEKKDLEDCLLICRRHKYSLSDRVMGEHEALIYRNFEHVLTIQNINNFTFDRYNVNPNNITYTTCSADNEGRPIHYMWNGKDAIQLKAESSMSFQEWCIANNKKVLLQIYAPTNELPVESHKLSWNSEQIVEWTCHKGHIWTEAIKSRTTAQGRAFFECPVCKKIKDDFNNSIQKSITSKEAEAQVLKTIEQINRGEMFLPGYELYPHDIEFTFKHPSNKHGYIAMYLAQSEGELEQLAYDTYKLTYSPSEAHAILRMFHCMSSMQYFREEKLCSNVHAEDYLKQYCLHFVLNEQIHIWSVFQSGYEADSPYQKAAKFNRDIDDEQRNNLNRIYDQMIISGEDVSTWKSERRLYALVQSIFSDAIFQFKADWLRAQSLDIYIPSLNIGVEYQGKQHYEPIDFFGGENAFEELQLRDEKKRVLCAENGVKLIEWKWTEEINKEILSEKVNKFEISF